MAYTPARMKATLFVEDSNGKQYQYNSDPLVSFNMECHSDGLDTIELVGYWIDGPTRQWSSHEMARRDAQATQVSGDYYTKRKIQPWDIWQAYPSMDAFTATIIKYMLRWPDKNGLEDLKKARHTLDKLIEIEEAKKPSTRNFFNSNPSRTGL